VAKIVAKEKSHHPLYHTKNRRHKIKPLICDFTLVWQEKSKHNIYHIYDKLS